MIPRNTGTESGSDRILKEHNMTPQNHNHTHVAIPPGHAMLPPLYKTDEVAAMLGITPEKLKSMRRSGRGPRPIPIGSKTIRYRMSAIEEYLTALEATGDYVWTQSRALIDEDGDEE